MQKISWQSGQSVLRAFVFLGVLTGLLFSRGEGIRLFPFPPEATENNHSVWKSGGELVYQKNLHRLESKPGDYLSKIQRDHQHHYWSKAFSPLDDAPLLFFFRALCGNVLFDGGFFKSRLFSFSGASRAPPSAA
ncbi:MAG TPA: hypothetical protein VK400_06930 [Pyrinomonadaceae bacterium]|nr:hypothetical protein [Pyrinomonadaceae bacterium]